MRRWLIFVLLLGLMVFPSRAGAQGNTKLASMNVRLWSEYDQPGMMLVINEFVVSKDTSLPTSLKVRFPKGGNLVAVASENNGNLFNANFDGPVEQGDWQTITLNVQSYDTYRVEYYEPLTLEGDKRQFKYEWFGDYDVNTFAVDTLIPADSTKIITTPILSNTSASTDGLHLVGSVSRNELKMGQAYEFKMEYTRTSDAVTNPNQDSTVQPSQPFGQNTPGRVSVDNLPVIIGGVGFAVIIIALFMYWRSTQASDHKPRRRRHTQENEVNDGQVYCHECGTRAHTSDRFCRTCGSKLRIG